MVTRTLLLGVMTAATIYQSAAAQQAGDSLDVTHLKSIKAEICAANESVTYIPVSHDVETELELFAIVSLANPSPNSAEIVTARERTWLTSHNCFRAYDAETDLRLAQSPSVQHNF